METKTLSEYWAEAKGIFTQRRERGKPEFPTGLKFIDDVTDGLHRGEVWIVAGRSGSGKTSLALQMAHSFSDNPAYSILFLSLEMKGWELVSRMFCEICDVDYNYLRIGLLPEAYKEKEKWFRDYITKIDMEIVEYGYTFEEVMKLIRSDYSAKKPDVIFVDFVQLVEWKHFKEQQLALMEYVRKMKELAKVNNIGIVVVSQVRRLPTGADYNRPPDIIDLLGSGALEQTADCVLIVYYKQEEGGEREYFIKVAKNRHGELVEKKVCFEGRFYRFREIGTALGDEVLGEKEQGLIREFNGEVVE